MGNFQITFQVVSVRMATKNYTGSPVQTVRVNTAYVSLKKNYFMIIRVSATFTY